MHTLRRAISASVGGILLYAATSWVTSFAMTGASTIAGSLRPGVAIPIFFGFVFGPLVGFVVGFFGNLLNDLIAGYASFSLSYPSFVVLAASLQLNWQLGNGLMGLVAGLDAAVYARQRMRQYFFRSMGITLLAVVVGIGVAAFLDPLVFPASYSDPATRWSKVLNELFIPISLTNAISALLLVPPLLFNHENLDLGLRGYLRSGLMRRLVLTIVITAAVPTVLLSLFLLEANAGPTSDWRAAFSGVFVNLAITVILTTLFVITNAAMMARSISKPLVNLGGAARAMEQGELTIEQAAELRVSEGNDEVAQLSRTFGKMAQEVIQREQDLRKHVQELQIIIDEHKRSDQVKEIVESDFFRDLKQKARTMRERGKHQSESADEQPV